MIGGLTLQLKGDRALQSALDALSSPAALTRVLANAGTNTMRPVLRDAKRKAPTESGTMKKSLALKTKRYPRKGLIFTVVGPRSNVAATVTVKGRSVFRRPVKYAALVEKGHRIAGRALAGNEQTVDNGPRVKRATNGRFQKVRVKRTGGLVPGRPFIEPAFATRRMRLLSDYKAGAWKALEREAQRVARRAAR